MMQRQLVVIAGPETGRLFRVEDDQTLTLGRGQASDTQISDPHMSRVHCRIRVDGGRILLTDAGSSAGTLIDGAPITEHELQPGEVFQM
jgi:pSer/pThr/pTyr-binding forkhead associated (FHA) protein